MGRKNLTKGTVQEARRRVRAGVPLKEVAAALDYPYSVVRRAVRGETWHTISDPPPLAHVELAANKRPSAARLRKMARSTSQHCTRCTIITSNPSRLCNECERETS